MCIYLIVSVIADPSNLCLSGRTQHSIHDSTGKSFSRRRAGDAYSESDDSSWANHLRFTNLSANLEDYTIRLKSDGDFTVLSVNHGINYLNETTTATAYRKLESSQDSLQSKLEQEQVALQVLNEAENLLIANKDVGVNTGAGVEKLKAILEYYQNRLSEIKLKKLEVNNTIKKMQENLLKVQNQLKEMSALRSKLPVKCW